MSALASNPTSVLEAEYNAVGTATPPDSSFITIDFVKSFIVGSTEIFWLSQYIDIADHLFQPIPLKDLEIEKRFDTKVGLLFLCLNQYIHIDQHQ